MSQQRITQTTQLHWHVSSWTSTNLFKCNKQSFDAFYNKFKKKINAMSCLLVDFLYTQ
jgi:hypothetical protein